MRSALSRLWGVVAISLCDEGLFVFAVATTHAPYLRSLVVCGGSPGDDDDAAFSGSRHCDDRDVVLARGAKLSGTAMALVVVGNVVSTFLWAPYIDAFGRKFVAVRSLLGLASGLAVLGAGATASARGLHGAAVALSFLGYVVMASSSGTTAAMSASASDLAPKDKHSQASVFAIKWCGWGLGTILAYGSGFFVLGEDLEDYSCVYFACAGLAVLAAVAATVVVEETLPAREDGAPEKRGFPGFGTRGLLLLLRSRPLTRVVAALAVTTVGLLTPLSVVASWGISQLDFDQQTLSLIIFLQQVGAACGFLLGGALRKVVRADVMLLGGNSVLAGALVATGFGAPRAPEVLWGTLFCVGLSLGLVTTTSSAVLGADVDARDQGIVQAASQLCGYVGGAVGALLGPRLYDPEARAGAAVALPYLAGAAIVVASVVGLAATAPTTRKPVVAADDGAAALDAPLLASSSSSP